MNFWRHDYFWPVVLIVLGAYFLLRNVGLLDWLNGDIVWPVLLILLGVWLIVRQSTRQR
jgi:phage shock protein C